MGNNTDTVEGIARNLDANHMLYPKKGAAKKDISFFETRYNVVIPAQYKEWLLYSDGGEILPPAGLQLYGVNHIPLIGVIRDEIPYGYIMIGRLANGDPVIAGRDDETITIYDHEKKCIRQGVTYSGFYAFIKDLPHVFARMIDP